MADSDTLSRKGKGLGALLGGRRTASRWSTDPREGNHALNQRRADARAERKRIDQFLIDTDYALNASKAQLADLPLPEGTDWRYRPALLMSPLDPAARVGPENAEGLGEGAKLFHDCKQRATILRQVPNRDTAVLAPYAISLEVMGFSGAFLSLALPLPQEALDGLNRGHVIQIDTQIEIERPVELFARLNISNGPNTDRLQIHLGWMEPGQVNRHSSAFDLAETDINPDRLTSAWIDLIIDGPAMNRVVLRDMVVSRHRRADI